MSGDKPKAIVNGTHVFGLLKVVDDGFDVNLHWEGPFYSPGEAMRVAREVGESGETAIVMRQTSQGLQFERWEVIE